VKREIVDPSVNLKSIVLEIQVSIFTMNPKLCKRLALATGSPVRSTEGAFYTTTISGNSLGCGANDEQFEKTSVRDAALLLSIADICKSEIKTGGLGNLWRDDLTLPDFPCLLAKSDKNPSKFLTPRTESLGDLIRTEDLYPSNRIRAVSIDSPAFILEDNVKAATKVTKTRTESPFSEDATSEGSCDEANRARSPCTPLTPSMIFTNRRLPLRKQSLRLSVRARKEHKAGGSYTTPITPVAEHHEDGEEDERDVPSSPSSKRSKPLQGASPKGIPIKKIMRKKFSWKSYPELEQFLIANREEYLRHSALNYTIQQKQYNNRLTERLLELATEHGYVFDTADFSFVTVRDRIRCYYKSYVQSAKKRGVLYGYAARKAGLVTEEDLTESAGTAGRIVTP
jgi:hypothetical protein